MKETIGEKIKRLRKEKGLTQENVHNNQSQISQIESGRITNPDENTLLLIAKNMEIPFDELINDTTWEKPESATIGKEIAFSPAAFDIEIDDFLNIQWSNRSFPLYNEKGEKNEYCPYSGLKLIDKCEKCGRSVEKIDQTHCFGCGNQINENHILPVIFTEILSDNYTITEYESCKDAITELTFEHDGYEYLLKLMEIMIAVDDTKALVEKWENNNKDEFGRVRSTSANILLKNLYSQAAKGIKPGILVYCGVAFTIQALSAGIKKLKLVIKDLRPPTRDELIEGDRYQMKSDLLNALVSQFDKNLRDPTIFYAPDILMNMIKDLRSDQNTDELIEKLQSKIDLSTKSDENSNDENISEDGNSETAAENETEQKNDNADNKDNKESNND